MCDEALAAATVRMNDLEERLRRLNVRLLLSEAKWESLEWSITKLQRTFMEAKEASRAS